MARSMLRAVLTPARRSAPVEHPAPADRLFNDIDGRQIPTSGGSWTVSVAGIHSVNREMWVQIGFPEDAFSTVVLRMPPQATAEQALAALEAWADRAGGRPRILEVMRLSNG